jgi:hypothetical protein
VQPTAATSDVASPPRHVLDLGQRIELVSMDKWLDDITIGLYRRGDPPRGVVHSYSSRPGAVERQEWLTGTMATLAGLESETPAHEVWFGCGAWHELGLRRAFLEACKVDPSEPVEPRPSEVDDPRSTQRIALESLGNGSYRIGAAGGESSETNRAPAIAAGMAKLLAIQVDANDPSVVRFDCGAEHDRLTALLLMRSINVRAAMRELEAAATRGVLLAPSAQENATPA